MIRSRRVKCDEGKPFCARCFKFGADCEGYEVAPPKRIMTRGSFQELLPRLGHYQKSIKPLLEKPPFSALFEDNREYSYFLYFQEEIALDISGSFDENLWNQVILQASWTEPSLCRVVASMGALNKATRLRAVASSTEKAESHQQYALWQYGRALKSIQALISGNRCKDTTRVALIASLLIYCFENMYGDISSAIPHLENALELMHKQLKHARRQYRHFDNASPNPTLDDDLVAAFVRLDNGLLSRPGRSRTKKIGSCIIRTSILDINYLENSTQFPEKFHTISEARNYLEQIQFCTLPSLANDLNSIFSGLTSPGILDHNTRKSYEAMVSELCQWNVAFAPLYAGTLIQSGNKCSVAAIMLRIRAMSSMLIVRHVCDGELSSSDLLVSEAREIVNLSKCVVVDPSFVRSFVWDCGVLPALSAVVSMCRDRSVQNEAFELLVQATPRQEGVWDSLTLVKWGKDFLQMGESV